VYIVFDSLHGSEGSAQLLPPACLPVGRVHKDQKVLIIKPFRVLFSIKPHETKLLYFALFPLVSFQNKGVRTFPDITSCVCAVAGFEAEFINLHYTLLKYGISVFH